MAISITNLGPYRLGKKVGQGGMGSVYAGQDTESGEEAAIKVLSPALAAEEGFRSRFEAEIESLKTLRHPNIVRLFGYGEEGGYLYYAMELVEGTSLEEELRYGRRFNWREVTRMSVSVCRALKHAHDHGIIHRDIKPANLLLSITGEIKLSDFGIARLFGNSRVTSEGGVLGTAEYMAPEQADGRPVTDRCDQYSLGGVMYALLAGRPPFRANNLVQMLQLQRFADPQPVRRYAPETPEELERIIHQLLSKDPQKRFANTLLLSRALEAMEQGLSRPVTAEEPRPAAPAAPAESTFQTDPLAVTSVSTAGQIGAGDVTQPDLGLPASAVPPASGTAVTLEAPTQSSLDSSKAAPIAAEISTSNPSVRRFVKVDPEREDLSPGRDDIWQTLISPQVMLTLAGLLVAVVAGWYLLRPPSADALYENIDRLANSGDVDQLLDSEKSIEDFLRMYPDDPRGSEVLAYREQLSLARRERRFEREARRLNKSESLIPVERAYLESVHLAQSNPDRALARFQSLINVCESAPEQTETITLVLELSRRQVRQLTEPVRRAAEADRQWAEAEYSRAAELAAKDPAAAHKIWGAIVELYGDKPSAADVVQKARAALGDRLGSRD